MEDSSEGISRRGFLKLFTGILAGAAGNEIDKKTGGVFAKEIEKIPTESWGKIANSGHEGDLTRGIFFFAGPPNPNSPYPQLDPVTDWNSDQNIETIFDEIKSTNVNVINLSWWGENGEVEKWAPTINTEEVNNRVFKEAEERNILVAPVIEVSPEFEFYKDFPENTQGFEQRIESLISSYSAHSNWMQLFDKNGEKRHFIRLVETIHGTTIDTHKFANAFDVVSEKIFKKTGKKLLFGIDPTPLPSNGSYFGPDEKELFKIESVIITPYNIFSDGETENERIEKADQILKRWTDSGIPVIMPLITGFDDTGTDRPHKQKFGNSESWSGQIRTLFDKYSDKIKGVSFDSWNTLTEGGADVVTAEYKDVNQKFAREVLQSPFLNQKTAPKLEVRGRVMEIAADK